MSNIDPWEDGQQLSIKPEMVAIKNKLLSFGLVFFLLSIYLPFATFNGQSFSLSEDYSTFDLLIITCILIASVYTAYTGVYAVTAKIIAAIILFITAYSFIDFYREDASEIIAITDLMGIDLSKQRGWRKLLQFADSAFYIYLLSIIMLSIAMFFKVTSSTQSIGYQANSQGSSTETSQGTETVSQTSVEPRLANATNWFKSQFADLKQSWKTIEYSSSPDIPKHISDLNAAIKNKDFRSAVLQLWHCASPYLNRVLIWITTTFNQNLLGKILIILLAFCIYRLFF